MHVVEALPIADSVRVTSPPTSQSTAWYAAQYTGLDRKRSGMLLHAAAHDMGRSIMSEPTIPAPLIDQAVMLAKGWYRATTQGETPAERATSRQLGALLADERGLDLAVRFVDRVARPEDPQVAAKELSRLSAADASAFLGPVDAALLGVGSHVAPLAPPVVVPIARKRLRQIVGPLVVDAKDPALGKHLAAQRAQGFALNVNLLGEAVLGEAEAASRTERTRKLLERPDVDYVSIKVSSLVSQISTWDIPGTVERVIERLRPLYRTAAAASPTKFVNLDMEEFRDLDLTIDVFQALLSEPEFHQLQAGIVLQPTCPTRCPRWSACSGSPMSGPDWAGRRSRSGSSRAPTSQWSRWTRSCMAGSRRPTPPNRTWTRTTFASLSGRCVRTRLR